VTATRDSARHVPAGRRKGVSTRTGPADRGRPWVGRSRQCVRWESVGATCLSERVVRSGRGWVGAVGVWHTRVGAVSVCVTACALGRGREARVRRGARGSAGCRDPERAAAEMVRPTATAAAEMDRSVPGQSILGRRPSPRAMPHDKLSELGPRDKLTACGPSLPGTQAGRLSHHRAGLAGCSSVRRHGIRREGRLQCTACYDLKPPARHATGSLGNHRTGPAPGQASQYLALVLPVFRVVWDRHGGTAGDSSKRDGPAVQVNSGQHEAGRSRSP
jgi:hypothetical protein